MTPKEKTKELVDKIYNTEHCTNNHFPNKNYCECIDMSAYQAKNVAILVVNEIMKTSPIFPNNADWDDSGGSHRYYYLEQRKQANAYWQEVKNELNQL